MLKFQAVAEKTAKNFRGLLFCRTLYIQQKRFTLGMHPTPFVLRWFSAPLFSLFLFHCQKK